MPAKTLRVSPPRSSVRRDQLVGAFDVLGVGDAGDAQLDLGEVVNADDRRECAAVGPLSAG